MEQVVQTRREGVQCCINSRLIACIECSIVSWVYLLSCSIRNVFPTNDLVF